MNFSKIILGIFLVWAMAVSCIREDMGDCLSTNYVLLSYKGDGTAEIFNEKVCRVEMFIFDSENYLVSSVLLPDADVEARKTQLPPLKAGNYRLVCLGNTFNTSVRNLPVKAAPYDGIIFADNDYFAGNAVSTNDSLYYASLAYTVEPFDARKEDQAQVIEFACSHYDVIVEVAGVPDPEVYGNQLPALEICGVTPCTDFENRVCGEATDYYLESKYDSSKAMLVSKFNIMRHNNHEDVNVYLRNSAGGVMAQVNLAEFLAANPSVDCTKQEVVIPIRIDFKSGEVTVTVPDWFIQDIKPEF